MLPKKPPRTKPLPPWATAGPDIIDTTDPTDLNDPASVYACCHNCVVGLGSEIPMKDVQECGSIECAVWNPRRKALEVITGKRKKM